MKRKKKARSFLERFRPRTSFSQLTLTFLALGVLPLSILTIFFSVQYTRSIRSVMAKNYSQINLTLEKNIEEIIEDADSDIMAVYEYTTDDGQTLNDIFLDTELTEREKKTAINEILEDICKESRYLCSARLTLEDGSVYAVFSDSDKRFDSKHIPEDFMKFDPYRQDQSKDDLLIMPAVSESYYSTNSDEYSFDLVRDIMDINSGLDAEEKPVATLYCGIDVNTITTVLEKENLGSDVGVSIYDSVESGYIFSTEEGKYVEEPSTPSYYRTYLTADSGNQSIGEKWLFYDRLQGTDYFVVTELQESELLGAYQKNILVILAVIAVAIFVLLACYMIFSRRMLTPHVRLKDAMEQMQMGNLDARVEVVHTGDEMEFLCDGFNHMAEDLQKNIEQSLVSQIFARQAELDALKMQIQPHYLYNTLDIIRMTALNQDDEVTANLLEALAEQLHYVIGHHDDRVTIREELDMLRTYFVINKVRFENMFQLTIDVTDEDQNLYILKLMLQPIVENAIKHGLRPKDGPGVVAVRVRRKDQFLEIVVMDDGVGMKQEQIDHIRETLEKKEVGFKDESGWVSIGMKNVYDRIHIDCGAEYGYTIESVEGAGTMVTFHLPIWEGDNPNEESDSRR